MAEIQPPIEQWFLTCNIKASDRNPLIINDVPNHIRFTAFGQRVDVLDHVKYPDNTATHISSSNIINGYVTRKQIILHEYLHTHTDIEVEHPEAGSSGTSGLSGSSGTPGEAGDAGSSGTSGSSGASGSSGSSGLINLTNAANNRVITAIDSTSGNAETNLTFDGEILDLNNQKIENVGHIQFDINYDDGNEEGRLQWNTDDGTLDIGMLGGNVNLQIGQEMTQRVRNTTGSTILNGTPVYVAGSSGQKLLVAPANADYSVGVGFRTIGVATEDIPHDNDGYITMTGLVRGIDMSAFIAGAPLYLAADGSGCVENYYTQTTPASPDIRVIMGVVRKAITDGELYVTVTTFPNIDNLSDVAVTDIQEYDILQWSDINPSAGTSRWENKAEPHLKGLTVGGATNYTQIDTDGMLTMFGNATVFDDWQGPLASNQKVNPSAHIVVNNAEASITFKTNCDLGDYIYMSPQMQHDWKLGSDIFPHIHWWQTTAAQVNWLCQYRWQRNGEVKTAVWTYLPLTDNAYTYTSGTLCQITTGTDITPPVGYSLSDIIQFRVIRDVANNSGEFGGAETASVDTDAVSFDYHYEIDTMGSNLEYEK